MVLLASYLLVFRLLFLYLDITYLQRVLQCYPETIWLVFIFLRYNGGEGLHTKVTEFERDKECLVCGPGILIELDTSITLQKVLPLALFVSFSPFNTSMILILLAIDCVSYAHLSSSLVPFRLMHLISSLYRCLDLIVLS